MAAEERRLLEQLADQTSDAVAAYRRLLEIAEETGDRTLQAQERRAAAGGEPDAGGGLARRAGRRWRPPGDKASQAAAVTAYERLLLLEPADQADVRLRLAKLLKHKDRRAAKRHLLEALAEAPRLRAGHQLLLELAGEADARRGQAAERTSRWPRAGSTGWARWRRRCWRAGWRSPSPTGTMDGEDRGGVPVWDVDKEHPDDVFTFVRVKYPSMGGRRRWGRAWHTDYPASDINLSFRLQQLTSLKVNPHPKVVELTDPALFDYPFVYMIEPGAMSLADVQVARPAPLPAGRAAS